MSVPLTIAPTQFLPINRVEIDRLFFQSNFLDICSSSNAEDMFVCLLYFSAVITVESQWNWPLYNRPHSQ